MTLLPRSKARRDVLLLTLGRASAAGLSFVWLLIVARELGPASFGQLATLLSLGAVLSALHDGGHDFALTESVARDRRRLVPSVIFVIRRRLVLGCAAAVVVVVIYSATFPWEMSVPAVFGVSILATAVYTTITAGLRGAEVIAPDAANEVLSRLVIVAVGLPVLFAGGGLLGVAASYSVTNLLSAVVLIFVFRRITAVDSAVAEPVDRSSFAWRNLIPLGATVAIGTIAYRIDVWMLAAIRGSEDAGIYGAAYRLQEGLFIPATALIAARVASILGSPMDELLGRVRRLGTAAVVIAVAPAAAVALAAPWVMVITFGDDYASAGTVLRLLLISSPISALVLVFMPALASRARTAALKVVTASAITNIVLNAILISRWGPAGAATATIVAQAATGSLAMVMLRRLGRSPPERSQNAAGSGR